MTNTASDWIVKRLDQVATVTMGQSPPSSSYNTEGAGVPFLQGTPPVVDSMGAAVPNQWTTQPTKIVEAGTALMTVRAPVGELFTSNDTLCLGRGLAGIKANNDVSQNYLNYYLQFAKNLFASVSQGSTFTAINSSDLKGIEVALPSYQNQEYFGKILLVLDQDIAKTYQIIQKTESLKQGLMDELLNKGIGHKKFKNTKIGEFPVEWKVERLGDIAKVERGKFSHRPRNDPQFYGGSIPFIQTGDVVNSKGRIKMYSQTLNDNGLKISKLFSKGTIVMTIAANIGDTGILEFDACFPDSLVGITPFDQLDSVYLEYYLRSRKIYLNSIATQSAQKNINLAKLNPMPIAVPPISEQQEIGKILSSLDDKLSSEAITNGKLKSLKNGLMRDIFSKKVEVN